MEHIINNNKNNELRRYKSIETTIIDRVNICRDEYNNFIIFRCSPEPETIYKKNHFFLLDKTGKNYKKLLVRIVDNRYNDNTYKFYYTIYETDLEFIDGYYLYEIIHIRPCKVRKLISKVRKVLLLDNGFIQVIFKESIYKTNLHKYLIELENHIFIVGNKYEIKYKKFDMKNYYRILEVIDINNDNNKIYKHEKNN